MALRPQSTAYQTQTMDQVQVDAGLRRYMLRIYNYMASGLAVSGLVAMLVSNVAALREVFFVMQGPQLVGLTGLGMITIFSPLIVLFAGMFMGRSRSAAFTQGLYWVFVTLMGVSLAQLMLFYTGASVARAFFITAGAFGGLSLYGYTTKRDLSGIGSFLIMGLIGLIIAMVVNMFLASTMMHFIISIAGVLIFSGLIAFDTQRLKQTYFLNLSAEEETKTAVWGALSLYLNFINLLQFLLMIMGNRN